MALNRLLSAITLGILIILQGIFIARSQQATSFTCSGSSSSERARTVSMVVIRRGDKTFPVELACFTRNSLSTAVEGRDYYTSVGILNFTEPSISILRFEINLRPNVEVGPTIASLYVSCLYNTFANPANSSQVTVEQSCATVLISIAEDDSSVAFCPGNKEFVWENVTSRNYEFFLCREGYLGDTSARIQIQGDTKNLKQAVSSVSSKDVPLKRGKSKISVNIPIQDDQIGENERANFTISLRIARGSIIKEPRVLKVTVLDNDIEFYFKDSKGSYKKSFYEHDRQLKVDILRRGMDSVPAKVRILFKPNFADCIGAEDPVINFPAGSTHQQVTLCSIVEDTKVESKKEFKIVLEGVDGSVVMPSGKTLTLNIINNDVNVTCSGEAAYEDSRTIYLKVNRTGGTSLNSTIICSSKNGTATSGIDYTPFTKAVVSLRADFTPYPIALIPDKAVAVEDNKTFEVSCHKAGSDIRSNLFNCSNINFTILNDDTYVFLCHPHKTYIREASGPYNVSLCRVGVLYTTHRVQLCWTSDGNGSPHDYPSIKAGCSNILFSPGDTRRDVNIDVNDDTWGEQEFKVFEISIKKHAPDAFSAGANPVGEVTLNGTTNFTVTIHDDDNSFCGIKSGSFYEQTDRYVNLTIKRWGEISTSIAYVRVKIQPKVAQSPHDYEASFTDKIFKFLVNETEKTETIEIKNDKTTENNEQFHVMLSGINGSTIYPQCRVSLLNIISDDVNILCNDTIKTVGSGVFENTSTVIITLERQGSLKYNHTIRIRTVADTAKPNEDYKPIDKVVTFTANETHIKENITIFNDLTVEPDDKFHVNVTSSDDRVNVMCPGIDIIIKNDDSSILCVNKYVNVSEGNKTVHFVLKRKGYLGKEAKIWYKSQDGSAYDKADYKPVDKTFVTFSKGQVNMTLGVDIVNDDAQEETEDFSVMIGTDDPTIVIASSCTTFNITDDDADTVFRKQVKELEGKVKKLEDDKKKLENQRETYTVLFAVAIGVLCAVFLGVVVLVFVVCRFVV